MPGVYAFEGIIPVVHPTAFIHPNATITGDVVIGRDVYIGPGAALRGDWGAIEIQDGCNVQENCTIHMFPGIRVVLEEAAHVGHGAIVHGARIGRNALIGMNAVVMDHAVVGAGSIVGALSFVPEGMTIPDRMIAVGNPARVVKEVSDEMLAWKSEGTKLYQGLPAQLHASLRPCEPLREMPADRRGMDQTYKSWGDTRSGKSSGVRGEDAGKLREGRLGIRQRHAGDPLSCRDRGAGGRRVERRTRLCRHAGFRPEGRRTGAPADDLP